MSAKTLDVRGLDERSPELFTQLDRHFADLMQRLSGRQSQELVLAARLASSRTGKGSVCVHIPSIAGRDIYDVLGEDRKPEGDFFLYGEDKWLAELKDSAVIGLPGDFKPLILDNSGRLYLYRYWQYEQKLAENIKMRLASSCETDIDILKQSVARLFNSKTSEGDKDINWQRIASIGAVLNGFCVISGGPGTGKTSTIIKILALLLEQGRPLKIALAAPTGKAAARLNESLKDARSSLDCSDKIKESIPDASFTMHRLLGPVQGSPYFRYNAENQLPYDIVVVDESSMADLALMSKLFEAVPVKSRLILLGDKDQLSSVEAGAVLGDICDTGKDHPYTKKFIKLLREISPADIPDKTRKGSEDEPAIADSIMMLRRSYRFGHTSGIAGLSAAIRDGDADKALGILRSGDFTGVSLIDKAPHQSFTPLLSGRIIAGYTKYIKANSPEEALKLFSNFTILCAVRKGQFGVERINLLAEEALNRNRLISKDNQWYKGRPVMIVRNDYNIRLYNGDTGIILADPEDGKTRFFTVAADGAVRRISPLKLPEHETVYAMTVHKSQGSEFNNVLLLLPDYISPVLTRELLYTAVTRARERVEIWGGEDILRYMIANPTERISGLRDALWGI